MGIHYCVHRPQNNCVTLEMIEGYSFVPTGFGSRFFQFLLKFSNCFKLFSFNYFKLIINEHLKIVDNY